MGEKSFDAAIEHFETALMKKIDEVGEEVHESLAEFYYNHGDALYCTFFFQFCIQIPFHISNFMLNFSFTFK